jgi:aspartate kinase
MERKQHTVEKIGGTSMSRARELLETLFVGSRKGEDLYNRIFVVSAFGGVTNHLLEHKKSGDAGVYELYVNAECEHAWLDALSGTAEAMRTAHAEVLDDEADVGMADDFVRERIEGARSCLIDLQRLCSYGHFRIDQQHMTVREMLAGLGEAHSAFVLATLLRRHGVNARAVDLTGWRDESQPDLETRITGALEGLDLSRDLPIVTGYAQCREGLVQAFDRGYTEVIFAHIAALTSAREAVIHKEFHLSSADPAIVGEAEVRRIGRTNFDVADQLSNLGMEAIHPRAAKILRRAEIPLRVTNAFDLDSPGTLISAEASGAPRVEMITGLDVYALELFEQDMVGVKGYDTAFLEALTKRNIRIVTKTSNANTIVHYVDAPLPAVRQVEKDLMKKCPNAEVAIRKVAIVSAVGGDLSGLNVMLRGLVALNAAGVQHISAHETGRNVDVMFVVPPEQRRKAIRELHAVLVEKPAMTAEDRVAA